MRDQSTINLSTSNQSEAELPFAIDHLIIRSTLSKEERYAKASTERDKGQLKQTFSASFTRQEEHTKNLSLE